MVALEVWRSARAEAARTLHVACVWAWLTLPLALVSALVSAVWASTAWQLPGAVLPALVSEAARRAYRGRRLAAAVHDVRALVGHEVLLMPTAEVVSLLVRGVTVCDGLQVAAVTEAEGIRFETEPVPPSAVPPLTTIFMRGGGAGGGGALP